MLKFNKVREAILVPFLSFYRVSSRKLPKIIPQQPHNHADIKLLYE